MPVDPQYGQANDEFRQMVYGVHPALEIDQDDAHAETPTQLAAGVSM